MIICELNQPSEKIALKDTLDVTGFQLLLIFFLYTVKRETAKPFLALLFPPLFSVTSIPAFMSKDPRLLGKPWPVGRDAQDIVITPVNSARTQGPPEERCGGSLRWVY